MPGELQTDPDGKEQIPPTAAMKKSLGSTPRISNELPDQRDSISSSWYPYDLYYQQVLISLPWYPQGLYYQQLFLLTNRSYSMG
ncbi:hypothetical protein A6R68_11776, partial [Neotoma lepida]